jgi:hypothetical protein
VTQGGVELLHGFFGCSRAIFQKSQTWRHPLTAPAPPVTSLPPLPIALLSPNALVESCPDGSPDLPPPPHTSDKLFFASPSPPNPGQHIVPILSRDLILPMSTACKYLLSYFFFCFSHSSIEISKFDKASHPNRSVRYGVQLKSALCIHVIKLVSYLPAMASDARHVPIFTYGIHIVPIHIYLHVEARLCQEATSFVCSHPERAVWTSFSVVGVSESVLCHTLAYYIHLKKLTIASR